MEKSISVPEWLFVLVMCGFLAFAGISAFKTKHAVEPISLPPVEVFVTGAVKEPVTLTLPHGAVMADVLARITPDVDAAVEKLFQNVSLHQKQVVVIPKRGVISIYLTGAVAREGVVYLPEGSRFPELLKDGSRFTEEADLRFLKRKRRLLKDGESIRIPSVRSEL